MQHAGKTRPHSGKILKPLIGILAGLLLFVVVIAVVLQLSCNALKSSQLYKLTVIRVKTHPEVVKAVGLPMKDGWFVKGGIKGSSSSMQANLIFPISGPKERGIVYAKAEKSKGKWDYSVLQVKIRETKKTIDILERLAETDR
jgi:hypothetical protein